MWYEGSIWRKPPEIMPMPKKQWCFLLRRKAKRSALNWSHSWKGHMWIREQISGMIQKYAVYLLENWQTGVLWYTALFSRHLCSVTTISQKKIVALLACHFLMGCLVIELLIITWTHKHSLWGLSALYFEQHKCLTWTQSFCSPADPALLNLATQVGFSIQRDVSYSGGCGELKTPRPET